MTQELCVTGECEMTNDPWLNRWRSLIAVHAGSSPVLELGCGTGEDSLVLASAGHRVVGIDLSAQAIAKAQQLVPFGEFHCQDIRAPFPIEAGDPGVIVASLSLHYFDWQETQVLVDRIGSTLGSTGILLCRLNSTNDHHYGASGHPQIAENYYSVYGEPKRFFDRRSVEALFGEGWRLRSMEEHVIYRYSSPKAVWEVVLERDA
jgi:SAM-dependent methyltransferase